jgi:uncharacterized membrane protein YccC
MDTLTIIATCAAILSPILSMVGVAFMTGGRFASLETKGSGYQAQLDRLERSTTTSAAECDGRISALREEMNGRSERINQKVENMEKNRASASEAAAGHFGKLEAMMASMKEQLDRLEREQQQQAHHQPAPPQVMGRAELLAALALAVQVAPMVKQILGREPQKLAA